MSWKTTASSRWEHSPADALILALGDPEQGDQPQSAWTPDLQIRTGCCVEVLGLWRYVTAAGQNHTTSPNTGQHHVHPQRMLWKGHVMSEISQKYIPSSNHEEILEKLGLRDVLQNNWLVLFKNVEVMKDKEKLSIWDRKRTSVVNWQNQNKVCSLVNSKKITTEHNQSYFSVELGNSM